MVTNEDIGKRCIIFNTYTRKWEAPPVDWCLDAVELTYVILTRLNGAAFKWPIKLIRAIDTP